MTETLIEERKSDNSRRDFLRNATIATGVVWAAPSITTVSRALGAEGSAPPPNDPVPCAGGTLYRFKYDMSQTPGVDGTFESGDGVNYTPNDACSAPAGVDIAENIIASGTYAEIPGQGQITATEFIDPVSGKWTVTFTLPAGCFVGSVRAKNANACETVVNIDGRTFTVRGAELDFDISNVSVVVCCIPE